MLSTETIHNLSLEILKAKHDLKILSNVEVYNAYREIYTDLRQADKDYSREHPGVQILK